MIDQLLLNGNLFFVLNIAATIVMIIGFPPGDSFLKLASERRLWLLHLRSRMKPAYFWMMCALLAFSVALFLLQILYLDRL